MLYSRASALSEKCSVACMAGSKRGWRHTECTYCQLSHVHPPRGLPMIHSAKKAPIAYDGGVDAPAINPNGKASSYQVTGDPRKVSHCSVSHACQYGCSDCSPPKQCWHSMCPCVQVACAIEQQALCCALAAHILLVDMQEHRGGRGFQSIRHCG